MQEQVLVLPAGAGNPDQALGLLQHQVQFLLVAVDPDLAVDLLQEQVHVPPAGRERVVDTLLPLGFLQEQMQTQV